LHLEFLLLIISTFFISNIENNNYSSEISFFIIWGTLLLPIVFVVGIYESKLKKYESEIEITPLEQLFETFSEYKNGRAQRIELLYKAHKILQYKVYMDKNEIVGTCIICHLSINSSDEIVQCPNCGVKAHKSHFLEWLKIKGRCPFCKSKIQIKTQSTSILIKKIKNR